MKMAYSIFARSARLSDDGLFDLSGGGLDRISSAAFPLVFPQLDWVVRLQMEPDEIGRTFDCLALVADPDGRNLPIELHASATAKPPGICTAHYHYDQLTFERPGGYRFQLFSRGTLLGESRLEAEVQPVVRRENQAMRQALNAIEAIPMRRTDGSNTLEMIREARAGGMYERLFPK